MGRSISIHALLAESDKPTPLTRFSLGIFLSTLSLRRATDTSSLMQCQVKFLSTLSLRRATKRSASSLPSISISIHALLAESDSAPRFTPTPSRNFYPRSPCGERHMKMRVVCASINFYPRSPCGERRASNHRERQAQHISIHALLAESDVTVLGIQHRVGISIHALLAESDTLILFLAFMPYYFYPRSPCGERQAVFSK